MPLYHTLGKIPHKRHTQFRKPDGSLYAEELVSTVGFSSMYSLVYHCYPPTMIKEIGKATDISPKIISERDMKHYSFSGFKVQPEDDYLKSRKPVLVNNDVHLSLAAPKKSMEKYFYKNADADEVIFVHEGSGILQSMFGLLDFSSGDYIIIPRGTIYRIHFKNSPSLTLPKGKGENKVLPLGEDLGGANRLFIIESFSPIVTCKRYRNEFGQQLEHSPYSERDFRRPYNLETHNEKGDFLIMIKKKGMLYPYTYATHPFDAIGWDGYHYPWAFSIHDYEPKTGRVHLPPPTHQTFEANGFVVCSFVPRLYDYHPEAIVVPYNHSNVDSDEVLYYVEGEFMSRKNVSRGQITLHPGGIPHGPHPGAVERSIGAKETKELAVMVDTFHPLMLTEEAMKIEDKDYYKSWME